MTNVSGSWRLAAVLSEVPAWELKVQDPLSVSNLAGTVMFVPSLTIP